MRFLPLFLLTSFVLASCTLPGTQSETTQNTALYEGKLFSMSVPKSWSGAAPKTLPTPKKWTIELAYVSPDTKYGFSNNLVIMSNALDTIVTSKKYSELNQLQTSKNYLEYTKTTDQDITFTDKETSRVYIFEARYNESSPRMKFVQTARVCGTTVYLLHFSLSLDKDPTLYLPLLQTFVCK